MRPSVKHQPSIVTPIKMGKFFKVNHTHTNRERKKTGTKFSLTLDQKVSIDPNDTRKKNPPPRTDLFIPLCLSSLSLSISTDSSTIIPIFRPITLKCPHSVNRPANVAERVHQPHTQQQHWSATID